MESFVDDIAKLSTLNCRVDVTKKLLVSILVYVSLVLGQDLTKSVNLGRLILLVAKVILFSTYIWLSNGDDNIVANTFGDGNHLAVSCGDGNGSILVDVEVLSGTPPRAVPIPGTVTGTIWVRIAEGYEGKKDDALHLYNRLNVPSAKLGGLLY